MSAPHLQHSKISNHALTTNHHLNALKNLKITDNNINTIQPTGKASLYSAGAIAIYADSNPTPTTDDDMREGWLFNKIAVGSDKFNYYFYAKGNKPLTLGDLKSISAILTIDTYSTSSDLPFFNVYTVMTGSGDAGAWYKSRVTYTLSTNETVLLGERVEIYSGLKPVSHSGCRQVEYNNKIITGTALDTEEIYTISIGSDSAAGTTLKILVEELGLDFFEDSNKIETRLKLT
tara:strand:+ start:840 stop:1538 length:699 start_codon:yes stop_codon:yes gene_type:complete